MKVRKFIHKNTIITIENNGIVRRTDLIETKMITTLIGSYYKWYIDKFVIKDLLEKGFREI